MWSAITEPWQGKEGGGQKRETVSVLVLDWSVCVTLIVSARGRPMGGEGGEKVREREQDTKCRERALRAFEMHSKQD